jgi:hypothetical protein
VKAVARIFLFLAGLITAVGVYVWQTMKPAELPQVSHHSPAIPKEKGSPMETLDVQVRILTQSVRLSHPCKVEVGLTNRSPDAVLINRRLAVGYRDSVARELFVEVYKRGSDEVISQKALLYQRNFSSPEEYVWLAPRQSIATSFDLFEWYSLPSAGEFELVVCYQADEPLAPKPDGLLPGTYCSERIAFNVTT